MAFLLKIVCESKGNNAYGTQDNKALLVQWNLDLVTDLVTQKSVTKSQVVTKSMYLMH